MFCSSNSELRFSQPRWKPESMVVIEATRGIDYLLTIGAEP